MKTKSKELIVRYQNTLNKIITGTVILLILLTCVGMITYGQELNFEDQLSSFQIQAQDEHHRREGLYRAKEVIEAEIEASIQRTEVISADAEVSRIKNGKKKQ